MTQEQQRKKKKGPPYEILPNKQIFPLMGLGTFKIQSQETFLHLFRKGLQIGYCKHIDTARFYNNQIPLGKAIKQVIEEGRCKREDLFIATKTFNHKNLDPVLELKQALKLMQLKYVDLYYLHWPLGDINPQTKQTTYKSIPQVWKQLQQCVRKGYTKHLGISNFNGQMVIDLLAYAKIKPIALQIQIHPYLQQQSLVDLAHKKGLQVIAYCPLGYTDGASDDQNVLKDELLLELSAKHNKSISQIILKSTLLRSIGVIPKTTQPDRLQQNFESWSVQLGDDQMKKIKSIQKNVRRIDGTEIFLHDYIRHFD